MDLTCIGFGAVFIVAGILFGLRKLLPRAWKKMTGEEKNRVRIKPLCINVGTMIALGGVIMLVRGLWAEFAGTGFAVTMLIWLIACVADVVFISKSSRYSDK